MPLIRHTGDQRRSAARRQGCVTAVAAAERHQRVVRDTRGSTREREPTDSKNKNKGTPQKKKKKNGWRSWAAQVTPRRERRCSFVGRCDEANARLLPSSPLPCSPHSKQFIVIDRAFITPTPASFRSFSDAPPTCSSQWPLVVNQLHIINTPSPLFSQRKSETRTKRGGRGRS